MFSLRSVNRLICIVLGRKYSVVTEIPPLFSLIRTFHSFDRSSLHFCSLFHFRYPKQYIVLSFVRCDM